MRRQLVTSVSFSNETSGDDRTSMSE